MNQALPRTAIDSHELADAFALFNQLSDQLTGAYEQLQSQVATLNRELQASRRARLDERAEKERVADRLGALLTALPAGVVLVDGRDRIDRFNPAAEVLFPGIAWGRRWSEVRSEQLHCVGHDGDWLLVDGRRAQISRRPLNDSGEILVALDVTEQRQLQQQTQRQERLSAMGEMVAQLAHQLRTPLATALLYAGQIRQAGPSDPRFGHCVTALTDGLKETEKLVSDMLAFARGGCFTAEPFDLGSAVLDLATQARIRFDALGAQLSLQLPACSVQVLGNREALCGAIRNLLENAVDHAGPDINVRLSLIVDDDRARIIVHDDGPGIEPRRLERIFDPFFTTRDQGTGLGLAFVHGVISEHGGAIDCRNDHGARFEIELPIHRPTSQPPNPSPTQPPAQEKPE